MADAPKGTLTPSTRKARRIGGSKWCSARSYAKACARFIGYHPVACSSASFAILSAPVKVRDGHLGRGVPGRETKRLRGKMHPAYGYPPVPHGPSAKLGPALRNCPGKPQNYFPGILEQREQPQASDPSWPWDLTLFLRLVRLVGTTDIISAQCLHQIPTGYRTPTQPDMF
jgi:hypothetical protein